LIFFSKTKERKKERKKEKEKGRRKEKKETNFGGISLRFIK